MSEPEITDNDAKVLIIGIGNDLRGDDAVGLMVARTVCELHLPSVTVLESSGDGTSLMEAWAGYDTVLVVDAVSADAVPGSIFRIDLHHHRISPNLVASTHSFGLTEAVELARVWGELPPTIILYGVQAANVSQGSDCSQRVRKAAGEVVVMIRQDAGNLRSLSHSGTTIMFHTS